MTSLTQSGQTRKDGPNLTINFDRAYISRPVVVVSGYWDGGTGGVNNPDTILDIDNDRFRVNSENKSANGLSYYINWIAIGTVGTVDDRPEAQTKS